MRLIKRIIVYVLLILIAPLIVLGLFVTQPTLGTNQKSDQTVQPEVLQKHVVTIVNDFHPRSFIFHKNLTRCAAYIRSHFRQTDAVVTGQLYDAFGQVFENVIAIFPGRTQQRVVIGAHYDACGDTPGADDNASAVAGLLELAKLLNGTQWNHTLELVAYCTEEPPFFETPHMGSAHHAKKLRNEDVDVTAMIALEMIGYFSDEPGSQLYPSRLLKWLYPNEGNFIAVIGNTKQGALIRAVKKGMRGATELPVYTACVPALVPGVAYSDHRNYWEQDYPAVMITDTAFLRNTAYHRANDTPDRLDYDKMAMVVVGTCEAIRKLDEQLDP